MTVPVPLGERMHLSRPHLDSLWLSVIYEQTQKMTRHMLKKAWFCPIQTRSFAEIQWSLKICLSCVGNVNSSQKKRVGWYLRSWTVKSLWRLQYLSVGSKRRLSSRWTFEIYSTIIYEYIHGMSWEVFSRECKQYIWAQKVWYQNKQLSLRNQKISDTKLLNNEELDVYYTSTLGYIKAVHNKYSILNTLTI